MIVKIKQYGFSIYPLAAILDYDKRNYTLRKHFMDFENKGSKLFISIGFCYIPDIAWLWWHAEILLKTMRFLSIYEPPYWIFQFWLDENQLWWQKWILRVWNSIFWYITWLFITIGCEDMTNFIFKMAAGRHLGFPTCEPSGTRTPRWFWKPMALVR